MSQSDLSDSEQVSSLYQCECLFFVVFCCCCCQEVKCGLLKSYINLQGKETVSHPALEVIVVHFVREAHENIQHF